MAGVVYASIANATDGNTVEVKKTGEMKVEASVPGTVNVSVQGTADVNIASTSDPLPTAPGVASGVDWGQVDVDATAGGTDIVGAASSTGLKIANLDATRTVFLGFSASPTLTTTNGYPLGPGAEFTLPANVGIGVKVMGITASGTARVAYVRST